MPSATLDRKSAREVPRSGVVDVSVVIPVKDGRRYLKESLPTLLHQDAPWNLEVILIDSGSTDGTVAFVRALANSDSRLTMLRIEPGQFHHARTRNFGASRATGRYVVFLNGDAVPQGADWLTELVGPIASGDPRGPVASYGRQVARADADILSLCRMAYNYGRTPAQKDFRLESSLLGSSMRSRRSRVRSTRRELLNPCSMSAFPWRRISACRRGSSTEGAALRTWRVRW